MTQEEQIQELTDTVKCRLAPSRIHGIGVVAIRDIKKGEQLHCIIETPQWYTVVYDNLTRLPAPIRQLILDRWSQVVVGSSFLSPNHDAIMLHFMNHSNEPNYDPITDCAVKDIGEGEEVFEDYRIAEGWEKVYSWIKN